MRRIIIELDDGGEDLRLIVPSSTQTQPQMSMGQKTNAARDALDAGAAPSVTSAGLQTIAPMSVDTARLGNDVFDAGAAPQA